MNQATNKSPLTLTDILRLRFKGIIEPISGYLNRIGLTPNMATMLGLLGTIVGAYFLARGEITLGGIIILFMAPLDALDGTMARLRGIQNEFGAFLDSVTDRYAELAIFAGLLFYYLQKQDTLACVLVYFAVGGSVLVSYTRARAQSLKMEAKVGIFSRVERFLVLVPCLIINQPMIALWATAILANITAIQRIIHVYKQSYGRSQP